MSSPCESCAFREGSETFDREPYNRFRGEVCALAGLPFYCHHGLNWRKPIVFRKGVAFDMDGKVQRVHICAGWRERVARTISTRTKNRMIRQALGHACLEGLEAAIGENRKPEKEEVWAELRINFLQLVNVAKLKIVCKSTKPK